MPFYITIQESKVERFPHTKSVNIDKIAPEYFMFSKAAIHRKFIKNEGLKQKSGINSFALLELGKLTI